MHVGGDGDRAGFVDAAGAEAATQAEERKALAHARPGQRPVEEGLGEAGHVGAVRLGLAQQEGAVAHGVGSHLRREVVRVG